MASVGLNDNTGEQLGGWEHVVQSLTILLTTEIGECVELRDYGSDIPNLIDRPMIPATLLDVFMATVVAIDRWEPRYVAKAMRLVKAGPDGAATLQTEGIYFPRAHLGDFTVHQSRGFVIAL